MSGPNFSATNEGANAMESIIMVTGASSELGQCIVQQLLTEGQLVRAVVDNIDAAKNTFSSFSSSTGGGLQLVSSSALTNATSSDPVCLAGVRAVINCSTNAGNDDLKVKELMDVLRDTIGTRNGINMARADGVGYAPASEWGPLDDVVMGGASSSGVEIKEGAGENGGTIPIFRGTVTTANNGGFASIRCKNMEPALDVGAYDGVVMRLYGNGMRYKFILRTDTGWDSVSYCRSFDTVADTWQTIRIPFSDFKAIFRAKSSPSSPPLNTNNITSVQLMLSKFEYDGQLNPNFDAGQFQLPIESIKTYITEPTKPRFIQVMSCSSASTSTESVLADSKVPYTIVCPSSVTNEPSGMPVNISQETGAKGKISRVDVAGLCVALLNKTKAVDKQVSVTSTIPVDYAWTSADSTGAGQRDWNNELQSSGL